MKDKEATEIIRTQPYGNGNGNGNFKITLGNIKVIVYVVAIALTGYIGLRTLIDPKADKTELEALRVDNKAVHTQYDKDIRDIRDSLIEIKTLMKDKK